MVLRINWLGLVSGPERDFTGRSGKTGRRGAERERIQETNLGGIFMNPRVAAGARRSAACQAVYGLLNNLV